MGTNVAAESYNVQEKAVVQIRVVGCTSCLLDLGKDGFTERTALCRYILLLNKVVYEDAHHVVFVVQINWGIDCTQSENHVYSYCISEQGHGS